MSAAASPSSKLKLVSGGHVLLNSGCCGGGESSTGNGPSILVIRLDFQSTVGSMMLGWLGLHSDPEGFLFALVNSTIWYALQNLFLKSSMCVFEPERFPGFCFL